MRKGNSSFVLGVVAFWTAAAAPAVAQSFTFTECIPPGVVDVHQSAVAWRDFDNDGDQDFVLAGRAEPDAGSAATRGYRNHRGAGFVDIQADVVDVGEYRPALGWGDYDNDGDLDLALAGTDPQNNDVCVIYRNDGSGGFQDVDADLTPIRACTLAWGDYDSDGDLDLLAAGDAGAHDARTIIYRNDGDDTFTEVGAGLVGLFYSSVAWGDYDNDGDLDLAAVGYDSDETPRSIIYRNDGGTFLDIDAGLTGVAGGSVAWSDYDNDGDLDLALAGLKTPDTQDNISKVYMNDDGTFVDIEAVLAPAGHGSSIAWGDCDQDGDPDLAICGAVDADTAQSTIYKNDQGVFTPIAAGLVGVKSCALAWADYDIDGDLELMLTGQTDAGAPLTRIYRNELKIGFWADLDNDGDVDLYDFAIMQLTGPLGP